LPPKYSICITCKNNIDTVEASLESILNQANDEFEVVVVDAKSNDGTLEVLRNYAKKGYIKLLVKKCSRGKGRQTAFENSNGDYIIANMDLDDIFAPKLQALMRFYHAKCEGKILATIQANPSEGKFFPNPTLGGRILIEKLGGWRDLQYAEDWDLWSRAAKMGRYAWTVFTVVKIANPHLERRHTMSTLMFRFYKYRGLLRLGRGVFDKKENTKLDQKLVLAAAKIAAFCKTNFRDDFNKTFDPQDPKYYVPAML
jgi:glycosyltransferase involved in cell wall biosynthesis